MSVELAGGGPWNLSAPVLREQPEISTCRLLQPRSKALGPRNPSETAACQGCRKLRWHTAKSRSCAAWSRALSKRHLQPKHPKKAGCSRSSVSAWNRIAEQFSSLVWSILEIPEAVKCEKTRMLSRVLLFSDRHVRLLRCLWQDHDSCGPHTCW